MPRRLPLLVLLAALPIQCALALQPLRILGAGFELGEPVRDCAADARTEAELADALRAPAGGGYCIPPFVVQGVTVCAGPSSQCGSGGCFVPVGPSTAAEVDATTGLVGLRDPLGGVVARLESQFLPACTATFTVGEAEVALRYELAHDGLDGIALGGLALPPFLMRSGAVQVAGCPGYNSLMSQIIGQMTLAVESGYIDATIARIGEPLDAVMCPIIRP